MNAFYREGGDCLAWDENPMSFGYRQVGPSWVYLIIAHEWGHAIRCLAHAERPRTRDEPRQRVDDFRDTRDEQLGVLVLVLEGVEHVDHHQRSA